MTSGCLHEPTPNAGNKACAAFLKANKEAFSDTVDELVLVGKNKAVKAKCFRNDPGK